MGGAPTAEGAGRGSKAAERLGKHQPTQPVAEGVGVALLRTGATRPGTAVVCCVAILAETGAEAPARSRDFLCADSFRGRGGSLGCGGAAVVGGGGGGGRGCGGGGGVVVG